MLIKLISLLVFLTTTQALYKYLEYDHIINLGDVTWDYAMKEFPNGILIYFYEPYCTSCRAFWPEYKNAAQMLFDVHSQVQLAKVECHDEYKLCDAKGIEHMPTIALYKSETDKTYYNGALSAQSLKDWVLASFDGKVPIVNNLNELFKVHSVAILVKQDNYLASRAYRELDHPVEYAKAGPSLIDKFEGGNMVVLVTQSGDIIQIAPEDVVGEIKTNVKKIYEVEKSAVMTYSKADYTALQNDNNPLTIVLLFKTSSFSVGAPEISAFDKTAKLLGNATFQFRHVNMYNDIYGETLATKQFGLTLESPLTIGIITEKRSKFLMNTTYSITEDDLQFFIEDFNNHTLRQYRMSAPVRRQSPTEYVKELVGRNYHEITEDPHMNVFVMFYFPTCELCEQAKAAWESLAYRYRRYGNLVIAKIDVSENDVRGFDLKELPIFVFYKEEDGGEGGKDYVQYTAGRNIKEFRSFLLGMIPDLEDEIIDL